jgi:hypothetical protein
MLINELQIHSLEKSQLIEEISSKNESLLKLKKQELVTLLIEKVNENELFQKKMIKKYPEIFALHPSKLEEFLGISKTERNRWTSELKLPVVYYESFRKWGQSLEYPMYNYAEAIQILNKNKIEKWRKQHSEKVRKNRKTSAKAAVVARKKNQSLAKLFYEGEWKSMLKHWYLEDLMVGASLQLAYWTMWVNRFAKEMQLKERKAIKKAADYREKKEFFYQLKAESLAALLLSPLCKIQFYRPDKPDKIRDLQFCQDHYDLWLHDREFDYISKWEFFSMYEKQIKKCPNCSFQIQKDYYSLYFLSINSGDIRFSFHTPYNLGKEIFPDPQQLENVSHHEQEGLFRFGRGLIEEEKIIFTEKNIMKYFNEALEKYTFALNQPTYENTSKFPLVDLTDGLLVHT